LAAAVLVLGIAAVVAGCADNADNLRASPTPADFGGIAHELGKRGIGVDHIVSGDAGCSDGTLIPTAIGFDAKGLDQPTLVRVHLYAFRDKATFDRLRDSVDSCARSFVTDPQTYVSIDAAPFVITSQGPWGSAFEAAVREALMAAAGTSG
jgi:hypothetical protein